MHYYKDTLNGKFPIAGVEPIDNPRFVEISETEWLALMASGDTMDHPYSPHVLNKETMEAASLDHIPPNGSVIPDPPPAEHPFPAGPAAGVIDEEAQ